MRFWHAMLLVGWVTGAALGGDPPRTHTFDFDPGKRAWIEQPPPPPGSAARDLYDVRLLVSERKFSKAESAAKAFIKKYGDQDALHPEILVARASALIGNRKYDQAHKVLQEFLNRYAGVAITEDALRLEFIIAEAYLRGVKRKVWGFIPVSGVDTAYEMLDSISTNYQESLLAEPAIKTKADHLFRTGEHALSELDYARMVREFPRSRYQRYATRRTAEAALASFAGVEYDEAALIEAEERFGDYQARYPSAANQEGVGLILEGIRERQAEKNFLIGVYYERTKHVTSAVFYYRSVLKDFPETVAAGNARNRLELLGAVPLDQPPKAP